MSSVYQQRVNLNSIRSVLFVLLAQHATVYKDHPS